MRMMVILVAAAVSLAGCGEPPQIYVDKGYVRLPAVPGNPGVAYFTLHGGTEDTKLLSVTAPSVVKSELHESMTMNMSHDMKGMSHDGMMKGGSMATMTPLKSVPLPGRAVLTFAPGGKHVMLYTINPTVKPGSVMPLIFTFSNNLRIEYDAPVIAAGAPAPKG